MMLSTSINFANTATVTAAAAGAASAIVIAMVMMIILLRWLKLLTDGKKHKIARQGK